MTSDEIKKALECCLKTNQAYKCTECRYYNKTANCLRNLMTDTVDLINRQKAEIEKLKSEQNGFADISKMYSEIKSEAIKEFAEKIKDEVTYYEDPCGNFVPFVDCRHIDNLAKEMVGEVL